MPKQRYRIMRDYMPKYGSLGLDMMQRTCALQVTADFADEADMVKKFRVALALQPLVTALFANSNPVTITGICRFVIECSISIIVEKYAVFLLFPYCDVPFVPSAG